MIAALAATLAKPLIKWGIVALAIALLAGLWRWERHDRIAAEATTEAAIGARDLARADTARWHDASNLRDAAIAQLNAVLARQNTAVQRLQFSVDQANGAAMKAEARARDARAQFDQRIREMEEEADAHPDQVVPLGPIVRSRVGRLWD